MTLKKLIITILVCIVGACVAIGNAGGAQAVGSGMVLNVSLLSTTYHLPIRDFTGTVDWGDGTTESLSAVSSPTHTFSTLGDYTIEVGTLAGDTATGFGDCALSSMEARGGQITSVTTWGQFQNMNDFVSLECSFTGEYVLTSVPAQLPSHVTSINMMFYAAANFNQDISSWNTSSVTSMIAVFFSAAAFNQNISSWDTSHVTDMAQMFLGAASFNQPLNGWDTSQVTRMDQMFEYAHAFNSDISDWDVSNLTNATLMFYAATNFNQSIGTWNTHNLIAADRMFEDAAAFNQDLSDWNVASLEAADTMFLNSGLSPDNYVRTLEGWATQALKSGVYLDLPAHLPGLSAATRARFIDAGWVLRGLSDEESETSNESDESEPALADTGQTTSLVAPALLVGAGLVLLIVRSAQRRTSSRHLWRWTPSSSKDG